MCFVLFFFNEPLELGFTQEKKVDSVAEDQHKWSANGPAAADEIQTKNKKYDTQQNLCFFHSEKQNSRGWSITHDYFVEKGVCLAKRVTNIHP